MQYYPYGGTRSGGGGLLTEYRFTGQRREPGIGLYDYGARYYEPRIGRFQSPDPIVPQPGDPQSLNRYAYVRNSPLRYTDPTGYAWSDDDRVGGRRPPVNCVSIICMPTPTPYPTWTPLFPPRATPAPPVVRAVPPTPYAGPWWGLGAPLTPTPTPDPILAELMAEPGQVNWTDLYHAIIFQGLLTEFPQAVGQKTVIHAAGRSGQLLAGPLVGYGASVGPGLYEHITQHDPLRVTLTDVVVDTGGYGFSTGTAVVGVVGVGLGGAALNVSVSPLAAAAGAIGGSAVGSVMWDLGIAPRIRGDVYRAWGIVFR